MCIILKQIGDEDHKHGENGEIEQFDEDNMDWSEYVERLEMYMEYNKIDEEKDKKVKLALTLMSGKVYAVAKNACGGEFR